MDTKKWVKRGIEILLALTLPVAMTSVVAQGHEEVDLPSAEGQLSEYIAASAAADGYYPIYPGENLPAYPGDEKWNGHYVMPLYAGPAPLTTDTSLSIEKVSASMASPAPADFINPYEVISVGDLATDGTHIYAGLFRTNEDGNPENILAEWKDINWLRLARASVSPYTNGFTHAVEVSGNNIYMGGSFETVDGVPARNIVRRNGLTWQALGKGLYLSPTNYSNVVNDIEIASGGIIYAGGFFNRAGDLAVSNIARWDGSKWMDIGGGVNGPVYAIAVMGSNVYVGGDFTSAGGIPAEDVARWDGQNWHAVGSGINSTAIHALDVYNNILYAGGYLDNASEGTRTPLAYLWDGTNWNLLGDSLQTWSGEVLSIKAAGSGVYIGGSFLGSDGAFDIKSIAYWDGAAWTKMGSGIDMTVRDIEFFGDQVLAAGYFSMAGNNNSTSFASWHQKPELVPFDYRDLYARRGKDVYLIGNYFTGNQPATLSVNGRVLDSSMVTDADGKIYIHFNIGLDAVPGLYEVKLTSGSESARWWMSVIMDEFVWQYSFDGYQINLPADLEPLPKHFLPLIRR